jgi:chemotaxis methyl-accepting protein methylase
MDENLDPLENIEPLKEEKDVLEKVMSDIENTANFNSVEEGIQALNKPDTIFTRLQTAFNTFKELIGREMTYSEMREMMG